ncbi:phage tail sheath C-terminal domain-containing protein [Agathobaculum sp. Marseille-P7918]|uniref:phage tail sheath C-terminal domain-containing protein n=1 Tax=Agathobaculum sp. Marseille-P7918 TaxID=2479843 RepID=UPI000F62D8A8|nr:phage tail sheath C-terminal domain-containing protein [Agathobaculum sp. Marseille-P7918]
MPITMPKIEITFRQQATTLIERSARGVAILIVRDDTDKGFTHKQYTDLSALQTDKALYTADNYNAISDMLSFAPYQSHVFRLDTEGTLGDTLSEISRTVKTGWLAIAGQSAEDGAALASWVKTQAAKAKSYKCIVHNITPLPDDMHVVHFVNEKVTFTDERGEQDGVAYLPSLLAILAVCNVERGCTNYLCSNLASVQEVEDNDAAVGAGKFILYIDEEGAVRIGQGINSLTSTDGNTKTEDMQFIETVEAMDMMRDDITSTFRGTYLGNYRNTRDNQMLFIAVINSSYFRQLTQELILDPDYANAASIDVEAQRAAWVASGKAEAADWDDDTVKATPYKRRVYLAGNVKILGSMTDLIFPINLF